MIREFRLDDIAALEMLYPAAFPDEDLLPLVRQLTGGRDDVMSLVADTDGDIVGHAAFTDCSIEGRPEKLALLGPVAIAPAWQQKGLGGDLIRAGLDRLRGTGCARVMVLGDPAYYRRFGFAMDTEVSPPHALPDEWLPAWQSINLIEEPVVGTLVVPEPWQPRELWLP